MRFGDREGPRGAFVQRVSGETWPGCGHFTTESAARQVRSREKQKAGTKNPCLGVWYGSCGGKLSLELIPAPAVKTENIFLPVPIIPHGPCNRKAPAQSNEQVLFRLLFFQDHRTLGGDGGLDELGGILGGEEQLLAALHILHGAQAFFNLVLSKKNGIGDP